MTAQGKWLTIIIRSSSSSRWCSNKLHCRMSAASRCTEQELRSKRSRHSNRSYPGVSSIAASQWERFKRSIRTATHTNRAYSLSRSSRNIHRLLCCISHLHISNKLRPNSSSSSKHTPTMHP